MRTIYFFLLTTFLCVIAMFYSCAPRTGDPDERADKQPIRGEQEDAGILLPGQEQTIDMIRIEQRNLPDPVRAWVNRNMQLYATAFVHTKEYGDSTYIFVSMGERRTGGYEVRILDVRLRDDDLAEVRVRFTRPAFDAMVPQVITYPADVAAIPVTGVSVKILPEGNHRPGRITKLQGIDSLREIVASSQTIKLFEPGPGPVVGELFLISGIALAPEGLIYYKLIGHDDEVREIGGELALSPLDWVYFEKEITLPEDIPENTAFVLVIFRFHEATGREIDPVNIKLTRRSE